MIGCGALARELVAVIDQAGLTNVDLTCLPATLHNRPGGIPALVRAKIRAARPRYDKIFIAYADCGTGGLLDFALADEGVERLPGAHCYEFYSGSAAFAAMAEEEPGTFYLTDFLVRNFDRLVVVGLGLDRHPELLLTYFGNYRRLVYLAQTDDPGLLRAARRAARRLGLTFQLRRTGYGDLATSLGQAVVGGAGATDHAEAPPTSRGRSRTDAAMPEPTLVPGANNVARTHAGGPNQAGLLRLAQGTGTSTVRVVESLPVTQERRLPRTPPRRCLHHMQQTAPDLRRAQELSHQAQQASHPAAATHHAGATHPAAATGSSAMVTGTRHRETRHSNGPA